MEPTKLVYMEDMHVLEGSAKVLEVGELDGRKYVVLDQTILYAQGGGQPADYGVMKSGDVVFNVMDVRFKDGVVYHYGECTNPFSSVIPDATSRFGAGDPESSIGSKMDSSLLALEDSFVETGMTRPLSFIVGDTVTVQVDAERRQLHKRLHSAAHILDMAVAELNVPWVPGKGYHFPDGPYVEYSGSLEGVDVDALKVRIEERCNQIIMQDASTRTKFVTKDELVQLCRHVPSNLPEGKPIRVVLYGTFGVPCGGTHVAHLGEVGQETVRKIRADKGIIKVGYNLGVTSDK